MKLFLTLLFDFLFGALLLFAAAILSKILAEEEETTCYLGLVAIDFVVVVTVCVAWLKLMGVI